MAKFLKANLSGGEVSPAIAARSDIAKYASALLNCENFFVRAQGGVSNRPGLEFVAEVKDSTKAVFLIPFEFNTEQTYALEFGDGYMRVHNLGGLVLDSSKTVSITGATQASPVVVTTGSAHGLTAGDEVYVAGVEGMTQLNVRQFLVGSVPSTTEIALQDKGGSDVDGTGYDAYTSGGSVFVPFELTTPYAEADLFDLKWSQSADVMTVTHPSYRQRELARLANDDWTLTEIDFNGTQAPPTSVSVTVNTTGSEERYYRVTAVAQDTGEESVPGAGHTLTISNITQADPVVVTTSAAHDLQTGDEIRITDGGGVTELVNRFFRIVRISATEFELTDPYDADDIDGSGYTAYSSGGSIDVLHFRVTNSAVAEDNTVTWTAAAKAGTYNVYRKQPSGIYGYIGSSDYNSFDDDDIEANVNIGPPVPNDPFIDEGNFPTVSSFFKQRRVFGNTTNDPQSLWFSKVGVFNSIDQNRPTQDDDGFQATISSSQINQIQHLVPLRSLVVLTSGGEWAIDGVNGVLTPSSVRIEPQGYYGATSLRPLLAGETALYMQPGQVVRDINYQFENDAYAGNDVSILARHLFEGHIVEDWAYAIAPFNLVWAVRDDGVLLGLTYLKEQNIFAWHRHITKGDFKSVCVAREGSDDRLYGVVERRVNGRTVKYVERMHDRDFTTIEDAVFVDSFRTYDSPVDITGFTQTNPVVVSAPGHGFLNGDVVDITGVLVEDKSAPRGYVEGEVNAYGYTVANATTNTFELTDADGNGIDGTGYSAYFRNGEVRKAISEIPHLWHLEGETLTGTVSGSVVGNLTVSNGVVTLPNPGSRVHLGIGYTSDLETVRIEGGRGTLQGRKKRIPQLDLQVEDTLGLFLGVDRARMREQKFPLPQSWGQPPSMVTGIFNGVLPPDWNFEGTYIVQQTYPLPMTILSLIPEVQVGGN